MKRGRGRPRREGADEEILGVALAMLREKGYRDLTVDAVAEHAGVAKTTIYRRWPSKGELVAAALAPIAPPDDAVELLNETAQLLAGVDDLLVLRAIVLPRREKLAQLTGAPLADELLGAVVLRSL
ncbi:MAG TPA: helix-turn-helix domain-containing protein [Thermoanaerobaculia bacterium]|nr:helix-turn-helix domain-containing protein [Thermoanaerobaculia bacterium]